MSESDTPTLPEIMRAQIAKVLSGMRGAMPGRVTEYDPETQSVSVQPLLKIERTLPNGEAVKDTPPVVTDVPVVFPGAGAYSITFPIAKGDTVLLVFADQSLDKWLVNGGIVDPHAGDPRLARRFHISDAIAIPGLRPFNGAIDDPPTDALVVTGSKIKLGSKSASSKVALKSDLDTVKPAIVAAVDAQITVLTAGLPGTAAQLAEMTALKTQLTAPGGWPVCAQKVEAE